MVLMGVVVGLNVASTWATWHAYGVVGDYVAGYPGVTEADLTEADDIVLAVSRYFVVALIGAGIVFMMWLWQARVNAEALSPAHHRRARGWVIGSWFCPVVNFWFPYMVIDDVYRASRPTNPPDVRDLRSVPGSPVLGLWWALWLGAAVLDRIVAATWSTVDSPGSLHTAGVVETIQSVVIAAAAVAIVKVMREITAWQDGRGNHA